MPRAVLRVAVVGVSHPPANRWASRVLRPAAILADVPALATGSQMAQRGEIFTVYMGDHAVQLHSGETRHYIDNLSAVQPSLWVATDGTQVQIVTADPYEGEALASDTERVVEALAMPALIRAQIGAFVAAHHVEEVFIKRKRVPATSVHDPRAPRILDESGKWVQSRGRAGLPPKEPK
jgi:hypothetical protein